MDLKCLDNLVPLNGLTAHNLAVLVQDARQEQLVAGTHLFSQGDEDGDSVYLISGEVTLSASDHHQPRHIVGGTPSARYPLSQIKPRLYSGIAITPVTILRLNSALIDRLLTWDQVASYQITEFESSEDLEWMLNVLGSETFKQLPVANANTLFQRFHPIRVKAGQIIIRQGEPGDYYYLIKSGKADVLRKIEKAHKVSVIDQIKEGEGFGEDALLTDSPRNATVVMSTDGILMRLGRDDFNELLSEPLVVWLELDEVREKVKNGAGLLDVRLEDEFLHGTIKGSVNLPLYQLRHKFADLDTHRPYIVFCQTGSRSGSAAFLLTQRGFQVSALRAGLDGLRNNPS